MAVDDTDGGEQAEGAQTGLADFFSKHAETELGISDSPQPSARSTPKASARPPAATPADDEADSDEEQSADAASEDPEADETLEDEAADETAPADDEGEEDETKLAAEDDDEDDDGFRDAASRHKLPTDFEAVVTKLPKEVRDEARGLFAKELKSVKAGFTRMTQEGREYRQREKVLLADATFRRDHPLEYVLDVLTSDPTLLQQLDERLAGMGDDRTKSVEQRHIQNLRRETEAKVAEQMATVERQQARGREVEALSQRLCEHYGVPFEVVEDSLILAVTKSPERNISNDEVRQIIKARAIQLKGASFVKKQEGAKAYVQGKLAAKAAAQTPLARARRAQGANPAPASPKPSGKDTDLAANFAASIRRLAPEMARE